MTVDQHHIDSAPTTRRRRWPHVLWMILLLVFGVVFGATNTQFGRDQVRQVVESRVSGLLQGAQLQIGRLEGNLLSGLSAEDIALTDSTGEALLLVGRARADYRLWPLLSSRLELEAVHLHAVTARARQNADSTWDWSGLLAPSEEESTWSVILDTLSIRDATGSAAFWSARGDSVLDVRNVSFGMDAFSSQADGSVDVGRLNLSALFQAPARQDSVLLEVMAGYSGDQVRLDSLLLQSERSQLSGRGHLDLARLPQFAFTGAETELSAGLDSESASAPIGLSDSTSLWILAAPFSLADVASFIPGLNPDAVIEGQLRFDQTGTATHLDANVAVRRGGSLAADLRWEEASGGAALEGSVRLEALDVDRITSLVPSTSPLAASIDVNLRGPSSDSLSGSLRAVSEAFKLEEMKVGAASIEVALTDGEAEGSIRGSAQGATLQAEITGRWLDATPSTRFDGSVTGLDIQRWADAPDLSSDATLSFSGDASGSSLADMNAALSVNLAESRVGAATVDARLEVSAADGQAQWSLDGRMAGGDVLAEGRINLDEILRMEATSLRASGVAFATLLQDDPMSIPPSRISATVEGAASLEDWRTGSGRWNLAFSQMRWEDVRLDSLSSTLRWNAGRGSMDWSLLPSDGAAMSAGMDIRSRGDGIRLTSEDWTWRELDVSRIIDGFEPASSLSGSGTIELLWDGAQIERLDLAVDGDPSVWGANEMSDLTVKVEATSRELSITASQDDDWSIEAMMEDWQEARSRVDLEAQFSNLDPLAFIGSSDEGTALNGSARATATLLSGFPSTGSFEASLDPSTLRNEALARAQMTGALADSTITAQVRLDMEVGGLGGSLTARPFDALPTFSSTGSITSLDVLPLLGRRDLESDVNLAWDVSGESFDPMTANWRVTIEGQPSRLDALTLDTFDLDATWDGSVIDVFDFSSRYNTGSVQINGPLNVDPDRSDRYSDLRATWYIGDLSPFQELVGLERLASRSGTIDVQVFGPSTGLDAEFLVSLSDLEIDDWHLSSLESAAWMTLDDEFLPASTTANLDLGYIALPTLGVRTSSLQIDQRGEFFFVDGDLMVDTGNKLSLSSQVNPFVDRPWLALMEFDLLLGGEAFALTRPASIVLADGWQVNRLEMAAENQHLSMTGGMNDSTGYRLQVGVDAFDIAPVGQLSGYPDLEGLLNGQVLITGQAENPLIDSRIDLLLKGDAADLARIQADVQSFPQGLRVDASVTATGSQPITAEGFLPVFASLGGNPDEIADRSADLDLTIRTEDGSIAWIAPFLDATVVTDIDGRVTADIEVGGSIDDPYLEGFLNLDEARFRLPEYGVTYRMNAFRSSLEGVTITLEEATVRSGDGDMDITGSIDFASLTNSSFDLKAELDRFRAVRNDELHTTISGDLALTGRTTRPDLTGSLTTANTSFWITDTAGGDISPVELTFDDEVMLAQNFGYRPVVADTLADAIWLGLSMDLSIGLERDTWIRQRVNPEMAIELSGRVDVEKERGEEDLNLFRSIEVVPDRSRIKQFGRDFRIREGVASFNGPIEEMVLQVEAEYEVPSRLNPGQPEAVITLRLDGRLDDLAFDLSSDPAMENTDIVSYIATGRPASESLQFSDGDFNNEVLVGVAASQLAGLVEGIASQSLGLDVVDIEQDGLKGTRLTAGKYLTPRLFVGVTQPFAYSSGSTVVVDDERELTLEYKVFEYLLLQLLADASDSPVRVNLAGRYSY